MIIGLKGFWVLTNVLVIRLTEFTSPCCTINTNAHTNTNTGRHRGGKQQNLFSEFRPAAAPTLIENEFFSFFAALPQCRHKLREDRSFKHCLDKMSCYSCTLEN